MNQIPSRLHSFAPDAHLLLRKLRFSLQRYARNYGINTVSHRTWPAIIPFLLDTGFAKTWWAP